MQKNDANFLSKIAFKNIQVEENQKSNFELLSVQLYRTKLTAPANSPNFPPSFLPPETSIAPLGSP